MAKNCHHRERRDRDYDANRNSNSEFTGSDWHCLAVGPAVSGVVKVLNF